MALKSKSGVSMHKGIGDRQIILSLCTRKGIGDRQMANNSLIKLIGLVIRGIGDRQIILKRNRGQANNS